VADVDQNAFFRTSRSIGNDIAWHQKAGGSIEGRKKEWRKTHFAVQAIIKPGRPWNYSFLCSACICYKVSMPLGKKVTLWA